MEKLNIKEIIQVPIYKNKVFRQRDYYSCGPRALQIVLSYFNIDLPYLDIKRACRTQKDGTEVDDIAMTARDFGLYVVDEGQGDIKKIKNRLDNGYLVVIMWYTGSVSRTETAHAVVIYDYDEKYFFSWDPDHNLGTVPITILDQKELESIWKRKGFDFSWMAAMKLGDGNGKEKKKERQKSSKRRVVPKL